MERSTKENIGKFVGETEDEQSRFFRGIKVGMVILALASMGLGRVNRIFDDGSDRPVPIERVENVDAGNLEELDLERGTLVYNDTEDTYYVYVDDTDVSPAQEPGWYEVDMNAPIVPEGKQ